MRIVVISGLIALALFLGLAVYLAPLDPSLIALQLSFTQEGFTNVLAAWKPQGVAIFRSHLPVDGVLLLAYGVFGYTFVSRSNIFDLISAATRKKLAYLLPAAALADSAENMVHWVLTSPGAAGSTASMDWPYALAGGCATLKWLGLTGFVVFAGVVWARRSRA